MPITGSTNQHPRPPPASQSNRAQAVGLSERGGRVSRGSAGEWKCREAGERRNELGLDSILI